MIQVALELENKKQDLKELISDRAESNSNIDIYNTPQSLRKIIQ